MAWEKHNRCGRAYRDGDTPALRLAAVLGPRSQADIETGHPQIARRYCWAHACRDDEVLCGRVELTVKADSRLGLAPRERRRVAMRFLEHLHPTLRRELAELVRRRGSAARRAAERLDPIELVFDDPCAGLQRITGWLEPPHLRHRDLHEIEFGFREAAS